MIDDDHVFTTTAQPVAIEGLAAVAPAEVRWGSPVRQEYQDLWAQGLDPDGRAAASGERAHWPGAAYVASGD